MPGAGGANLLGTSRADLPGAGSTNLPAVEVEPDEPAQVERARVHAARVGAGEADEPA